MSEIPKSDRSLYARLAWIIFAVVVVVLSSNATLNYYAQKEQILADIQQDTDITISRLQNNLVSFIESYAITEYEVLVASEAEFHNHLAIIVRNYPMGRVTGQPAYISGQIHDNQGRLIPFESNNPQHQRWLTEAANSTTTAILNANGKDIGKLTVYNSNKRVNDELETILSSTLSNTFFILLFLAMLLLVTIHRIIVRPIARVTDALGSLGDGGIPMRPIPRLPYRELSPLTDTINVMLSVVRQSRESMEVERTRLQNVIHGTGAGTWEWRVPSGELLINEEWAEMVGYRLDELMPANYTTWSERVHPDDLARSQELIEQHFSGETPEYRSEIRMRHKDGHWVWILALGSLSMRDSNGEPLLMSGTHIDISESKQQELEIAEQRRRLNDILIGTNVGTWEWNIQSGEVNFNERWADMLGYRLEELEPLSIKTWMSLAHPDDLKKSDKLLQQHFSGELPYYECEARMLHKDGHWVWVLDRGRVSSYTEDGQPLLMAGTHQDITRIKEYQKKLEHIAHFDPLTNLPNRVLFADRLHQAMVQAERQEKEIALIYLDLDGFKSVNDNHGHDFGDSLLSVISTRMKEALREGDTLARVGGDEFVGVLLDLSADEPVSPILERLLEAASRPVQLGDISAQVSVSIGVSFYPQSHPIEAQRLMQQADEAMYLAKREGKNRYRIADHSAG